ncbi:MAG TPA: hypothetical protein VEX18_12885, partial [Polyangiaceae bacterium]|nr:hypothetical protein [Polyangiaceae bacterium]
MPVKASERIDDSQAFRLSPNATIGSQVTQAPGQLDPSVGRLIDPKVIGQRHQKVRKFKELQAGAPKRARRGILG